MLKSPVEIDLTTILSLIYRRSLPQSLAMVSGDRCSDAMKRRVAPLSLLVPVVGLASAALLLDETLSALQLCGAGLIMAGLYINVFGLRVHRATRVQS